ncbi:metalloendoproteinase 1-like [Rhododendron vialii]|uniref:metalloendoproteinase 1-like n=1 Tax=Rhododendron vialii TaxID=182163 RepID=UPI0026604957|nr:metalloendoproteinase 1-like [Rhododendron vialii]
MNYSPNQTRANDDDFDDSLEAAVKTYQLNYHLKTTGTLDAQTVSQKMAPRCGFRHIIRAQTGCERAKMRPVTPRTLSTLCLISLSFPDAKSAVARAFNTWTSQTQFRFFQSEDLASADLKIGFYRGDHGDGYPFFGQNGVMAHSLTPTDGRFHYNADYSFSMNPVAGSFHLETVALHEIGHLLGLGHSSVEAAIMWSSIPVATVKGLHADDIQGINTLYDLEPVRISSFVFQRTV